MVGALQLLFELGAGHAIERRRKTTRAAVSLVDGTRVVAGDALAHRFSFQSSAKLLILAALLEKRGPVEVFRTRCRLAFEGEARILPACRHRLLVSYTGTLRVFMGITAQPRIRCKIERLRVRRTQRAGPSAERGAPWATSLQSRKTRTRSKATRKRGRRSRPRRQSRRPHKARSSRRLLVSRAAAQATRHAPRVESLRRLATRAFGFEPT